MNAYVTRMKSKHLLLPIAVSAVLAAATAQAGLYQDTVLADQPVAYYPMEDAAGAGAITNAVNPSANQGMLLLDELGAYPKLHEAGVQSNSASFHLYTPEGGNPQTGRIDVPYAAELSPTGPFSVEFWARATGWGDANRAVLANVSGFYEGWWFRQEAGTTPRWLFVQNGGNIYMATGRITKNEWMHVAVTYDGTTTRLYANGQETWTSTGTPSYNNGNGPLSIGGSSVVDGYFDGNVDEVAIYNKTLTVDQLRLHYEVGKTNIAIPPVPASVVTDPAPTSTYAGRIATFSVNADGTAPLSYQWYKGNTPIDGATNEILKYICSFADNNATFKVAVTNLYGSDMSGTAALTVMTNLSIVGGPASITRSVGSKAAFKATPGGALPVTYQWYKGTPPSGTLVNGATDPLLWLRNVQMSEDNTSYYCRMQNPWETTNTEPATLTVVPRAVTVPVTGYAKVVMADDPVAFWRLDEPDMSLVAVDAAGSFDGSYTPNAGNITYGVDTGIPHETNKAVSVNGKAHVQIPWALELNPPGPFSVELWMKAAALHPGGDFIDVSTSEGGTSSGGPNGWLLYQMPDNSMFWVLFSTGWGGAWLTASPAIEANKWYHVVLSCDGSMFRSYINGAQVNETPYADFVPNPDGWTSLGFRYDGGGAGFNGSIDDVAFYNKPLSLEQIQAHYLATVHLDATRAGNDITLTWAFGTLQQADQAGGTYSDMSVTSPYKHTMGATPKYFRVKVQ